MNLFYSTSFPIAIEILKNIYENFSSKKEGLSQPFVEYTKEYKKWNLHSNVGQTSFIGPHLMLGKK